jgi:DNA polymerase I-like protein with 3'-5' exonuclease and polymerase domains
LLTGVLTLNDKYKLKLKGCDQAGTLRLDGEPTGNTDYSLLWILNNEKVFNKACKEGIDFLFNELFMHENQPCGFLIRKKARTLQYVGNKKGIFHFIGLAIKTACYAQYQTEYIVYKTKTEDTYEFNLKGIISEKDFTYTDIQGKFTSIKQDIISGNLSFSSGKIKVEIEFYNIPEYTEYLTSIKYKTLQIANPFSTNITAANFKERVEIGYDSVRSLLVDLQYLLEKKDMGYIKDKKYWKLNKVSDFFEYLQYLKETKRVIKADYETTGLKINSKSRTREADRMVGLAISVNKLMKTDHPLDSKYKDVNYYIPVYHTDMENIFTELTDSEKEKILSDIDGFHYDTGKKDELKQAIEDDDLTEVNDWIMMGYLKPILEEKELANANISFDWKVGYIYGIDSNFCEDSQLAAQLLIHKYSDYGLKELTYKITGRKVLDLSDFSPVGDWSKMPFTFRDLPEDYVLAYAPADVDNLDEILDVLNKELEETNQTIPYAIEVGFAKCIGYQEFWGYHMPPNEVDKLNAELLEEKDRLLDIIYWGAGKTFNMDSPAQLLEVLQSKGHEITSTKKEVLKQLYEDDFILAIKEYRTISQMIKLFIKPLPEQMDKYGNIYPSTMSMGARTGRTSASKPNYQQANDWVRKYIKAREGYYLVDSDLSQIEYRVTATLSKQEALLEMFKDFEKDYHTYQTSRMFKIPYELVQKSLRKQAKAINFGLPFGMGDSTLGYNIFGKRNNETKMKAAGLRKVYFEGQEKVLHFFEDTRDRAVQNGYTTTAFKRRRYYDFIKYSVNSIRKQAGNAVIQGTAADIFKLNCIRMMYHIKKYDLWDKVKMLAFVHDEILLEVRNDINPYFIQWLVRECMEYDYKGFCPVFCGVGFGHSWYEAKSDLSELNTQAGHQLYGKADSIYWSESEHYTSGDVVELMGREIKAYKIRYLTDYMMNPDNMDKVIRPYAYAMLQDTNKGYYVGDLLIDGANVDKSSLQLKSALTLNKPTKEGLEGLLESFITVYMPDIEPTSIKIIDPESIKEEVKEEAIKDKEIMLLEDIHIGGITGDDYLLTIGYYADSEQLILNLAGLDIGKIEAIKRFIIKHRDEDEDYLVKLVYMTQDSYSEIKEFAIGYQYSRKLMDYVLKNRTLESIMA